MRTLVRLAIALAMTGAGGCRSGNTDIHVFFDAAGVSLASAREIDLALTLGGQSASAVVGRGAVRFPSDAVLQNRHRSRAPQSVADVKDRSGAPPARTHGSA